MKYKKINFTEGSYFITAVLLAVMFLILIWSCLELKNILFSDYRENKKDTSAVQYYTSVEIESGDSLWSIASEYMTDDYESIEAYVEEIKTINGLGDDRIHAGKFLLVPYYFHP
ncbi:MAG: LysM peptidoglycan-binding domain-containing protein [Lachnospiraceae bacterium]|nr:LysM peptidoglycan-binding domain-containing protein [Lachnospiraceae bacterium]